MPEHRRRSYDGDEVAIPPRGAGSCGHGCEGMRPQGEHEASGLTRRCPALVRRGLLVLILAMLPAAGAWADEGGVSFWLSGQYASLAAVPPEPGWYFSTLFHY